MFMWLVYLLFGLAILLSIIAIYCIICFIILCKVEKKYLDASSKELAHMLINEGSKMNFFVKLILSNKKIRQAAENMADEQLSITLKKVIGHIKFNAILIIIICISSAFLLFSLGNAVKNMNDSIQSFVSLYTTLFGKSDCVCYAKCIPVTEDNDIDSKCTYELLFGEEEYEKLVDSLSLQSEDLVTLQASPSGKAKGQIIIRGLTKESVLCYKLIIDGGNFRSGDHKNRSKMTDDELKADLILLLSDYKVNGVNPLCECCKSLTGDKLSYKCIGENHYVPGWTWDDIWDPGDSGGSGGGSDNDNPQGVNGGATGEYAIELDDGNYYWYHQSSEACANNVNSDTYGRVSDVLAGGTGNKDLAYRGCGVYTLAICLSNLKGNPVTPYDVITDLMNTSLKSSMPYYYFESYEDNGIKYSSDDVYWYPKTLAKLIEEEYGKYGIHAEAITWNQETIDSYLNATDKITYIMGSWGKAKEVPDDPEFLWYTLSGGHFMAIRKKDAAGKYYCFTSCSSKPVFAIGKHNKAQEAMSSGISWDVMSKYAKHSTVLAIWRDKSSLDNGGGDTGGGVDDTPINVNVYETLAANPTYSGKAKVLAATYELCMKTWGDQNIAIGMMANVFSEGQPGLVEGLWHRSIEKGGENLTCEHVAQGDAGCKCVVPYWTKVNCNVHNLAYKHITSHGDVQILLSIPEGVPGIGVGPVQWSGGRRKGILLKYNSLSSFTEDNMMMCDIQYMREELLGTYSGVISMCRGKTVEECAKLICTEYESPTNENEKAVIRAGVAADLKRVLSN